MDFYKRIVDMQGSVEEVVRKVPGFKGYFERQDRRAADKLLRDKLARSFEDQLAEFSRLQGRLVDGGGMDLMERVQSIDTRLRTVIDKIESAPRGYTGLFDAAKVNEKTLADVYAFDSSLLAYQDQLATGLRAMADAIGTDGVSHVLDQLDALVSEIGVTLGRRADALHGLAESV
jgi:hypothetical protein